MNCPVCGKPIKDEAIFCIHCGSKIPRCPTCGKVFDKPVRFCGNDGTPLPEEMFAVLTPQNDKSGLAKEQPRIQPASQSHQFNTAQFAATPQSAAMLQQTEQPVKSVSGSGKKKKPLALILLIILLLLMVGVGIVIGICFPDKLKDMLPESVAEVLMPDEGEKAGEKASEIEEPQQTADDADTSSGTSNAEQEETTEGSSASANEAQEESALEKDATADDISEETSVDEAEEDIAEDTSNEEETVAEEEELDKVLIFILNSDCYYFTEEDIADFDAEMCRLARNGIYAKMGRKFNDASLTEYFSQYDWYEPTIEASDFSESMLNAYQIANRNLIVAFETAQGYR